MGTPSCSKSGFREAVRLEGGRRRRSVDTSNTSDTTPYVCVCMSFLHLHSRNIKSISVSANGRQASSGSKRLSRPSV